MAQNFKSFFIRKALRFLARRVPALRRVYAHEITQGILPDFNETFMRYHDLERAHQKTLQALESFKGITIRHPVVDSGVEFKPKVSVIMPIYHSELSELKLAVDSIRSQTYPHFELLIIHIDTTHQVLDWLVQLNDPRIRLLQSDIANAPYQRNLGIQQSTGDIIAYLDDDNIWFAHYLEYTVLAYSNPDVHCTFTGQVITQSNTNLISLRAMRFDRDRFLKEHGGIDGNVFAHRKELFLNYGGWDSTLTRLQDLDLISRYSKMSPPYFIPILGGVYLENGPNSISETQSYDTNLSRVMMKNGLVARPPGDTDKNEPAPAI